MKTDEILGNQIEKSFEVDFEVGDFMTVFTLENMIKNEEKEGNEVYFRPTKTANQITLDGVGIDASIGIPEPEYKEIMPDFFKAFNEGKSIKARLVIGEISPSRTSIKLKFEIFSCKADPSVRKEVYNPFKDKNILPVKRMTIKEDQPTNYFIELTLDGIRSKKERGIDCVFQIKEDDCICWLYELGKDDRSLFSVADERVYDYVFKGYTVYARMKEIDTLMKEYGIVTIKYDILIVE